MAETSALSKYVSVYIGMEKLNFSGNLMGSEFIVTSQGKDQQGALTDSIKTSAQSTGAVKK